ncbi:hypothetical protein KCP70_21165 [Salmonella enterica subsp. enterica]|nr:hypothetical protein KCP70_21165 [Salmonella enterica subsp. enterica]
MLNQVESKTSTSAAGTNGATARDYDPRSSRSTAISVKAFKVNTKAILLQRNSIRRCAHVHSEEASRKILPAHPEDHGHIASIGD